MASPSVPSISRLETSSESSSGSTSTGYLFQLQGTFQAVKLKATNWHRGEFPLLPDDGSRVGNSKHRQNGVLAATVTVSVPVGLPQYAHD